MHRAWTAWMPSVSCPSIMLTIRHPSCQHTAISSSSACPAVSYKVLYCHLFASGPLLPRRTSIIIAWILPKRDGACKSGWPGVGSQLALWPKAFLMRHTASRPHRWCNYIYKRLKTENRRRVRNATDLLFFFFFLMQARFLRWEASVCQHHTLVYSSEVALALLYHLSKHFPGWSLGYCGAASTTTRHYVPSGYRPLKWLISSTIVRVCGLLFVFGPWALHVVCHSMWHLQRNTAIKFPINSCPQQQQPPPHTHTSAGKKEKKNNNNKRERQNLQLLLTGPNGFQCNLTNSQLVSPAKSYNPDILVLLAALAYLAPGTCVVSRLGPSNSQPANVIMACPGGNKALLLWIRRTWCWGAV